MKKFRYWIRRNFGFSQREVNGFLVLIGLMVLLTAAPFLFSWLTQPKADSSGSATDRQLLDSLVAQLEAKQPSPKGRLQFTVPTVALRPFNPNHLSEEEWQAFGVPKFLAKPILNYRNKVGDFTYKAELGKIYEFRILSFSSYTPTSNSPKSDRTGIAETSALPVIRPGQRPTQTGAIVRVRSSF